LINNPSSSTGADIQTLSSIPSSASIWKTEVTHFWGNRERDLNIANDPLDTAKNIKPPGLCRDPQNQAFLLTTISDEKTTLQPGGVIDANWGLAVTGLTKREIGLLPAHEQPFEYTSWMHRSLRLLSNALTAILNGLGTYTGFGVAVILVTLMVKLLLHRLNVKQQRSMIKMQQLAPDLARLKAQCGADRQQFALKQMELWKKHGVNPLAGCLPILIQLPIFFALFNTFSYSADMRGHHFLWLRDLTLPDQTFYLGFDLPNLITGVWPIGGGPATLNILPLLYLGASLAMTFTQPQPTNLDPDSQQAQMMKIMKWMPILFVCFFYDMPSGLVLYFTAQAILSAVESIYIRKQMAKLKK
jgi:YidC/Oxa1 family membrane protein insertase